MSSWPAAGVRRFARSCPSSRPWHRDEQRSIPDAAVCHGTYGLSRAAIPALRSRLTELFASDLRDLHDALESTELRGHYWVWGGLLLGWARDGAILPHDSLDADFAVADDDFQRLINAVPAIVEAGFKCDRYFANNDGYVTEITVMRRGARFNSSGCSRKPVVFVTSCMALSRLGQLN